MKTFNRQGNTNITKYIRISLYETTGIIKEAMHFFSIFFLFFIVLFCALTWPKEFVVILGSVIGCVFVIGFLIEVINFWISKPLVVVQFAFSLLLLNFVGQVMILLRLGCM